MLLTSHPQAAVPCDQPTVAQPGVVLDTNVVLDWLWFGDPRVAPLAAALRSGQLRWHATAPMRAELNSVLGRLPEHHPCSSRERVLTSFDHWVRRADVAPPAHRLRCTDADDQKFIDLALATGAAWLFSRDRAVLRLGRRAAALGTVITVPERWPGA